MADDMNDMTRNRTIDGTVEVDETTVIRAEIVETRERMGGTLEELGERLNPQHVKEQVKDGIRDATIGRVGHMARNAKEKVRDTRSGVADTIRDNPVPAAMVAIGLGWLMWNGRRDQDDFEDGYGYQAGYGSRGYGRPAYRAGYASGYAGTYGNAWSATGRTGSAGAYAGGDYDADDSGLADRARERAGDLKDSARETASDLTDRARDAAGSVAQGTRDFADTVARRTRRSAGRVEDSFYENPLAIGAVSLAFGLAAGLAAPVSDREVALMGDTRDRLMDRVKDKVSDTAEKVQHVAERAADETKSAAREEGLTG